MSDQVTVKLDRKLAEQFLRREPMDVPPIGSAAAKVDQAVRVALDELAVPDTPPVPSGGDEEERRDLAQWAHERAVIEDRLLKGAFTAEAADFHREMIVNFTAAAVALEAIPEIIAERDSRLTKEAVSQWLRSDEAAMLLARRLEPLPWWPGDDLRPEGLRKEQEETALACVRDARHHLTALAAAFDQPSTGGDAK